MQSSLSDAEIVDRVRAGEVALFELIVRRHNERVYRTIRSILRDESEVEDAMQDAYAQAFEHLGAFAGRSQFSTWLTRIAVNEALVRCRRQKREVAQEEGDEMTKLASPSPTPEDRANDEETQNALSGAIDALPIHFRTVFVLRLVQELSIEETAQCLGLNETTVKTRLHRARALMRRLIFERTEARVRNALPFHLSRCDRVTEAVMQRVTSVRH